MCCPECRSGRSFLISRRAPARRATTSASRCRASASALSIDGVPAGRATTLALWLRTSALALSAGSVCTASNRLSLGASNVGVDAGYLPNPRTPGDDISAAVSWIGFGGVESLRRGAASDHPGLGGAGPRLRRSASDISRWLPAARRVLRRITAEMRRNGRSRDVTCASSASTASALPDSVHLCCRDNLRLGSQLGAERRELALNGLEVLNRIATRFAGHVHEMHEHLGAIEMLQESDRRAPCLWCAPSMSPGTSATTKLRLPLSDTTPRFGISVVNGYAAILGVCGGDARDQGRLACVREADQAKMSASSFR